VSDQPDQVTRAQDITEKVVASFGGSQDPRLRELLQSLVRHLHAFAVENDLTEGEWMEGIQFLTRTGSWCTDTRQEFILLSDTLGLSMVVDLVNHDRGASATESTVLGPFYVAESPWRNNGDPLTTDLSFDPLLVRGQVRDPGGQPLPGATVDVWQNAANMLYAIQDPGQPADNLRGRFRTDSDGRFWFLTIRPVDYPIPDDGPVGEMLASTGRHPWRPAHIHVIVSAPRHRTVTTHIFDADSPHLDSDAVFAVKTSLVRQLSEHQPDHDLTPPGVGSHWFSVDCDIVLETENG
jgi:protocatechuate 3,4-dioxygenase beta subunit